MADPGEVAQAVGRAYGLALVGCLEVCVLGFQRLFDVQSNPDKLSFRLPDGKSFSFDFSGVVQRKSVPPREVLLEAKGYTRGADLLPAYRDFVARSMVVAGRNDGRANDLFWFVANVPFGSSIGRGLSQPDFIYKCVADSSYAPEIWPDEAQLRYACIRFAEQLSVCILPDSFMRLTGVRYRVQQDDNLWLILKKLHGGIVPVEDYAPVAEAIALDNDLQTADVIQPLTSVHVPWFGIPSEFADEPAPMAHPAVGMLPPTPQT